MTNAIPKQTRRGTSLTEVLVALVVLTIGLTSVIALFPVGVNRVRNATLDTRTTLMGMSAPDLFQLKRMGNDPALVNWAASDQWSGLPSFDPLDLYESNKYGFIPPANGFGLNLRNSYPSRQDKDYPKFFLSAVADDVPTFSAGDPTTDPPTKLFVREGFSDYNLSYPLLLDPFLFDQLAISLRVQSRSDYVDRFPRGVPRINIATALEDAAGVANPGFPGYYVVSGVPSIPYCDIPVVTLSEIGNIPPFVEIATPTPWPIEREMVKTHWFASKSDVQYVTDLPGVVRNPSARDYINLPAAGALVVQDYYQPRGAVDPSNRPTIGNPIRPTASRVYDFTWAALIQRRLVGDYPLAVPTGVPPYYKAAVGRPNSKEREFHGKLAILCFYRRNLNQPYTVIEGCFYNGSRKVTLSWPSAGVTAPTINIGTWLCEASISRSTFSGGAESPGSGLDGACNRHTGFYDSLDNVAPRLGAKRHYRRSFSFHRVVEVGQPRVDGNRVYLEVLVERPAQGFPLRWSDASGSSDAQDQRPLDTYADPHWPIFDPGLTYDDETNLSQASGSLGALAQPVQYYPVIIFDGLREVFERTF